MKTILPGTGAGRASPPAANRPTVGEQPRPVMKTRPAGAKVDYPDTLQLTKELEPLIKAYDDCVTAAMAAWRRKDATLQAAIKRDMEQHARTAYAKADAYYVQHGSEKGKRVRRLAEFLHGLPESCGAGEIRRRFILNYPFKPRGSKRATSLWFQSDIHDYSANGSVPHAEIAAQGMQALVLSGSTNAPPAAEKFAPLFIFASAIAVASETKLKSNAERAQTRLSTYTALFKKLNASCGSSGADLQAWRNNMHEAFDCGLFDLEPISELIRPQGCELAWPNAGYQPAPEPAPKRRRMRKQPGGAQETPTITTTNTGVASGAATTNIDSMLDSGGLVRPPQLTTVMVPDALTLMPSAAPASRHLRMAATKRPLEPHHADEEARASKRLKPSQEPAPRMDSTGSESPPEAIVPAPEIDLSFLDSVQSEAGNSPFIPVDGVQWTFLDHPESESPFI